ncbi:MAG: DUF928 domain-containing protein [Cyanothece sp. SIO1E1]|nr:DUF928 domain-containing protein [Cyanothece sp. SIO1E1]
MTFPKVKVPKPMVLGLSGLSFVIVAYLGLFQAHAQSEMAFKHQQIELAINPIVHFIPPTNERVKTTRGGASRTAVRKCMQDEPYQTALTPVLPAAGESLTVSSHPTFWVYIPETSAPQAHFTLKDADQRGIYQALVPISKTGGMLALELPEGEPGLELNKTYYWSVALICQPTQSDIPAVEGQVKRILPGPSLRSQLAGKSDLQQAAIYGREGIWYDMLNNLAQPQQTQPNDSTITANWVEILSSEGLEAIATQPLLD